MAADMETASSAACQLTSLEISGQASGQQDDKIESSMILYANTAAAFFVAFFIAGGGQLDVELLM